MRLQPLPTTFTETRRALHLIHFYALSYARQQVDGEVWLSPSESGIATPAFGGRVFRVDGTDLVEEVDGVETNRAAICSLDDALAFAGVEFDRPRGERNDIEIPEDTSEEFAVDPASVAVLAEWYGLGERVLDRLMTVIDDAESTEVRLWGEHFDLAIETGSEAAQRRASVGFSPGDEGITEPYVYVAPWWKAETAGLLPATQPFGVAIRYSELRASEDPGETAFRFLTDALERLAM